MQFVARARHRDIQQAPLLFDHLRLARGKFRGKIAVGDVEHINDVPFLPLGRMNGGQNHVVVIL